MKIFKKNLQKITYYWIILWLFSWAFSFIYTIDFPIVTQSVNTFLLHNLYLIDFTSLILIFLLFANNIYKTNWMRKETLLILSFGILAFLSIFWSGDPSLTGLQASRIVIYALTAIGMAIYLKKDKKRLKTARKTIIFLGIFQGIIAISQFILQHSLGLHLLGESVLTKDVLGASRFWIGDFKLLRAYGTFPHPNILGGFLLMTLAVTFWSYQKNDVKSKKGYLIAFVIQLLGLLFSFSRASAMGLVIIAIIYFVKSHNRKKKILIALSLFILTVFTIRSINSNILSNEGNELRMAYAKASISRFTDSPILGRAWGTGPQELAAFSSFPFYVWEAQPVHNIYLLTLSSLGFTGFILFVSFILLVTYRIYSSRSSTYLLGGVFISYLFIGIFDHYFLTLPHGINIFLISSLWSVLLIPEKEKPQLVKKVKKLSR